MIKINGSDKPLRHNVRINTLEYGAYTCLYGTLRAVVVVYKENQSILIADSEALPRLISPETVIGNPIPVIIKNINIEY